MKRILLLAVAALLGVGSVCAALSEADLAPGAVNRAIAAKPAADRQAFAKEVLGAVSAQPIDDESKTQSLVRVSRALIAGAGAQTVNVIAEVFNSVPVAQLQGVADLLATANFGQKTNGLSDAAYDKLVADIVKSASQYIEASGTDSPAVRMGILAAAFSKASEDPERTRPLVIAALPASVQAAAATYVGASERGNRELIAAAAGVDGVEPTPADPDAGSGVAASAAAPSAPEARTDYLEPQPPTAPSASDAGAEAAPEAKVPLLSRFAVDALGLTLDTMRAATYDWDSVDPAGVRTDPVVPTLPGFGNIILEPGEAYPAGQPLPKPGRPLGIPSPGYGNQVI